MFSWAFQRNFNGRHRPKARRERGSGETRSEPGNMMTYLAVALGGALGAMARYGISGWVHGATGTVFPLGTLLVNIIGSFVIGIVLQVSTDRFVVSPEMRLFLTTGFCGGLTTFSTFSYETLRLIEDQQWAAAGGNTLLNVVLCLGAVFLGVVVARMV